MGCGGEFPSRRTYLGLRVSEVFLLFFIVFSPWEESAIIQRTGDMGRWVGDIPGACLDEHPRPGYGSGWIDQVAGGGEELVGLVKNAGTKRRGN